MSYYNKIILRDLYGFESECTPMGEQRSVEPIRLVGSIFIGDTVDTNFWTITNANNGTTTQTGGELILQTSTTSAGNTIVQSNSKARYLGGTCNRYRSQIQMGDTGTASNVRRWGMFDGTNGAYFKLDGSTMSVCTMKGGSETAVASASWNGSTTVPTLTNCNTFEIYITNKKVYFNINDVLVHTSTFLSSTWSNTTVLPVRADNTNGAIETNISMKIRVQTIYSLGNMMSLPRSYTLATGETRVLKYGAGILHRVIVNNGGAASAALTLYDNTAGSGVFGAGNPISIDVSKILTPYVLEYNAPFYTGLTYTSVGTTNITIVYE